MKNRALSIFVLVSCLLLGSTVFARQDDPQLDKLFNALSTVQNGEEAEIIQSSIWKIWLTSGSDTVDYLMLQGMNYMSQGQFDHAIALFSTVIKIDPEFSEGWNKRATVLFLVGEFDSSIEDIGRTLELEPRHFGALAGLGQIYELQKSNDDAISAYQKAIALNPHLTGVKAHMQQLQIERDKKKI